MSEQIFTKQATPQEGSKPQTVQGYGMFKMHNTHLDYESITADGHNEMTQLPRAEELGGTFNRKFGRYGKIIPGRIMTYIDGREVQVGILGNENVNPFFTKKKIRMEVPDNPALDKKLNTVLQGITDDPQEQSTNTSKSEKKRVEKRKDNIQNNKKRHPRSRRTGFKEEYSKTKVEKSQNTFKVILKSNDFGMFKGEYISYTIEDNWLILCYDINNSVFTPPPTDEEDESIRIVIKDGNDSKSFNVAFTGVNFELEDFEMGIQVFCKLD